MAGHIAARQAWDALAAVSRKVLCALVASGGCAATPWAGLHPGAFTAAVHQARQLLAALRRRGEISPGPRGSNRCQVPGPAPHPPGSRRAHSPSR